MEILLLILEIIFLIVEVGILIFLVLMTNLVGRFLSESRENIVFFIALILMDLSTVYVIVREFINFFL